MPGTSVPCKQERRGPGGQHPACLCDPVASGRRAPCPGWPHLSFLPRAASRGLGRTPSGQGSCQLRVPGTWRWAWPGGAREDPGVGAIMLVRGACVAPGPRGHPCLGGTSFSHLPRMPRLGHSPDGQESRTLVSLAWSGTRRTRAHDADRGSRTPITPWGSKRL